ncbi:hypothetical protein [Cyclobacterium jeungdonense]|uniref:Uncharacterized protein n=1 Tax=Cyclobacterium jeungdonense TaxID=708087 RepID=A0ABT8C8E0_9BACT|nr:hypothetical protein [Cyclobacterium jeungdonense]MDN3689064.1 hypothetical protein [Cyclobacterium jeungdonense]
MNIRYKTSDLSNPTMIVMMEWVKQCKQYIEEEDQVFASFDELARQLEYWRLQHRPKDMRCRDAVQIQLFGDHEILISDQLKAEFIQITKCPTHVQSRTDHQ